MNSSAIISAARAEFKDSVYVGDEGAYEAFSSGKTLFDVSEGAELLHQFVRQNQSEFDNDFHTNGARSFVSIEWSNRRVYFTYSPHRYHKYIGQREMWNLEMEHPELFSIFGS